jgi:hypothetical protein
MATNDRPDTNPAQPDAVGAATDVPVARVRAVARVTAPHRQWYRTGVYRGHGRVRVPRSYRFVRLDQSPRPVFVDDTGRRGRLLAVASVLLTVVALLLVAAFWLSQTTWPGVDLVPQDAGA